jgi:hypothetical protein
VPHVSLAQPGIPLHAARHPPGQLVGRPVGVALPLGQAHRFQYELVGLKGQLQAADGAHRAPDGDLARVEPAQAPTGCLDGAVSLVAVVCQVIYYLLPHAPCC